MKLEKAVKVALTALSINIAQIGYTATMTAEQQAIIGQFRQLMTGVKSGQMPASASSAESLTLSSQTNIEIQKKTQPNKTSVPSLKSIPYGFSIDDEQYVDPEGSIQYSAFNVLNGDVVYSLKNNGIIDFKFLQTSLKNNSFIFAKYQPYTGQIVLLNGQKMNAQYVIPYSKGIIAVRENVIFIYKLGDALQNYTLPDGWHLAEFQHGAIDDTNLVLLERNQGKDGGVQDLTNEARHLGALLGINKKEDYALWNLKTKQIQLINMQIEGKTHTDVSMSNCIKMNRLINSCKNSQSVTYETLYTGGHKNLSHYYWGLNWFSTNKGALALYTTGVSKLSAIQIENGQERTVFNNPLGFTDISFEQDKSGAVIASAEWARGVKKYNNNNVQDLFDNPK